MSGDYLLSTKALLEYLLDKDTDCPEFFKWSKTLTADDNIYTSVVSVGELHSMVESSDLNSHEKRAWRDKLESLTPLLRDRILEIGLDVVNEWAYLKGLGGFSDIESLVVAQAIKEKLIYVGSSTKIIDVGISVNVLDIYNGKPWPGTIVG